VRHSSSPTGPGRPAAAVRPRPRAFAERVARRAVAALHVVLVTVVPAIAPAQSRLDDRPPAQGTPSPLTPVPVPTAPIPSTPLPNVPPAPIPAVPPPGAAPAAVPRASGRPRIGLALSGGGARGFAHVGVLRALETMRIPVDCIAGTSAGSAVGAAYATGHTPDEIEASLRSVDWDRDMFDDAPPRRDQQPRRRNEEKAYLLDLTFGYRDGSVMLPPGLISGQKIELFLHRMLGTSGRFDTFDRLPIPFRAIATDLERGEMVVQDRGSLVTAVRASMAVPSAFSPVQSEGRLLVDGGLTRNMPVDVVRQVCADVVIAVDIGGPLLKREELGNPIGVAGQMIGILMERNMRESREQVRPGIDVMITPDLGDIGSASFSRGVGGIPAGEAATLAARERLERLVLPEAEYAAWRQTRGSRVARDDAYTGVRVVGASTAVRRSMIAQAEVPQSGTLDRGRIERAINVWNSSGDFDRISYSLMPDGAGQVLELQPIEKAWGPNFLRFGLSAAADSNSNGLFNVLFGYRRPSINAWGGEFKSEFQFGSTVRANIELFQPINRGTARAFVTPQLLFEEVPVWIFAGRDRVAEYGVRTLQAGIDLGVQGLYGEARLGGFTGRRDTFVRTGSRSLPDVQEDYSGAQLSLIADHLDATDFPREGYLLGLTARLEHVRAEAFDIDELTHRVQLVGKKVESWGNHTFAAAFRIGEGSQDMSLNQAFSLGGFMNMSGLQLNQILGTSLRYGSLSYQNQILTLPHPLGRGIYAGVALEGARMRSSLLFGMERDWIGGATVFLGAHTGIGPVYLGYGYAQGNNRLVYLFLGRPGL
jgi:NTE family protein